MRVALRADASRFAEARLRVHAADGDLVAGPVLAHGDVMDVEEDEPAHVGQVAARRSTRRIRTTCGCTAPEWPREPIAPGKTAKIKVVFNSAGKMGMQNKVITVMSNAVNNPERVKIVTNVMPPDPNN